MYFVSASCLDRTEHISFISGVVWGILAFQSIHFGNIWWSRKGPNFWFLVDDYSADVDGWAVVSGVASLDLTGVLPSSSSFFSTFNILAHWVSSRLMAAPRRKSINLDVEMLKRAATSRTIFGL